MNVPNLHVIKCITIQNSVFSEHISNLCLFFDRKLKLTQYYFSEFHGSLINNTDQKHAKFTVPKSHRFSMKIINLDDCIFSLSKR